MELIQTIEQFAWIGWVVLILIFLVIEMLTLDFTFLMLGIGGVAGLVSDLFGAPIWLQVIIAAIVAAVLVLVLRPPLLRRLRRGEDPTPTNVAALVGLTGQVLSTVTPHGGPGEALQRRHLDRAPRPQRRAGASAPSSVSAASTARPPTSAPKKRIRPHDPRELHPDGHRLAACDRRLHLRAGRHRPLDPDHPAGHSGRRRAARPVPQDAHARV